MKLKVSFSIGEAQGVTGTYFRLSFLSSAVFLIFPSSLPFTDIYEVPPR